MCESDLKWFVSVSTEDCWREILKVKESVMLTYTSVMNIEKQLEEIKKLEQQ